MATLFPSLFLFDSSIVFPLLNFNYYCFLQQQPWYMKNDEFMINIFKVKKCLNTRVHNWAFCPYTHPGERIQRRDPNKYRYKRQMCHESEDITKCRRGDKCKYSHGLYEYWLHPTRYRTRLCNMGFACRRRVCFFAHSILQLRLVVLNPGYGACGDGQYFPFLRDYPPYHTLVGREASETSGTSFQRRLNDGALAGIDEVAMMNWHMVDMVMKLLVELDGEFQSNGLFI